MKKSELLKDLKQHKDSLQEVGVGGSCDPYLDRFLRSFTDEPIDAPHGKQYNRFESLKMLLDGLRGL